jgi:hypothetical protein
MPVNAEKRVTQNPAAQKPTTAETHYFGNLLKAIARCK